MEPHKVAQTGFDLTFCSPDRPYSPNTPASFHLLGQLWSDNFLTWKLYGGVAGIAGLSHQTPFLASLKGVKYYFSFCKLRK